MWIVLIILIILLLALIPAYPYSRRLGWWPSGIIGLLLIVFIILLLTGTLAL